MSNSNILYAVGGFMLGAVIGGAWHFSTYLPALAQLSSPYTASSTNQLPPESGAVSVANQSAGDVVMISSVTVPPPGVWVAVQEVDEDGTLGNVLGASRARQPISNLAIQLFRPTVAGQQYAVTLYRDDGNDVFDRTSDSAYVDFDTGSRVEELFRAQ